MHTSHSAEKYYHDKVFKFHEIFLAGGKTFSLFTDPQHSPFSLNTQSSF